MEQHLVRNSINASEYGDFLAEYENLIWSYHMTKSLPTEIVKPDQHYYSLLSYVTAVQPPAYESFSRCRMTNRMSLNDHMLIGPKLQKDLAIVIMQ